MRIIVLLALTVFIGCKTTAIETNGEKERVVNRYEVFLHLKSLEDVNRVFYRFENLRMELVRDVTEQPVQRIVSIECADHEIEGIVEKMNRAEGVVSAKRYP